MDYVNIDITVISDPQEDNSYIVTARTTGRTSEIASWRFLFSVEGYNRYKCDARCDRAYII